MGIQTSPRSWCQWMDALGSKRMIISNNKLIIRWLIQVRHTTRLEPGICWIASDPDRWQQIMGLCWLMLRSWKLGIKPYSYQFYNWLKEQICNQLYAPSCSKLGVPAPANSFHAKVFFSQGIQQGTNSSSLFYMTLILFQAKHFQCWPFFFIKYIHIYKFK